LYDVVYYSFMFEDNAYVRCLLVNFSKAFDVVSHDILIHKLTGLLTILVKSIGNININTLDKNYCQYQYQYFYRQYFFYSFSNHRCI